MAETLGLDRKAGHWLIRKFPAGILPEVTAILIAFLVGAALLFATGYSPLDAYVAMLKGAFGDVFGIGQTLTQATPIMFTGLSFLLASKCGLFNIGAEGQLLVGGLTAAVVGTSFHGLPALVYLPLALAAAAVAGGFWGLIPAVLKARLGAHEVITTMMLSYVASYLTSYMVNYPFKAPGWVAQTVVVDPSAQLPSILPPTQLSASLFIALVSAVLSYYFLDRTTIGYEIRAVGLNPRAAENAGISVTKNIILALTISGAVAGIGGAGEVLGVHKRFIDGFSPGYGWDGIAVALVGRLNPVGIVLAALLFGSMRSGGMVMTRVVGVPLDIVMMLQAFVILFVAAPGLIRYLLRRH